MSLNKLESNDIPVSWLKTKKCAVCLDEVYAIRSEQTSAKLKTNQPMILQCYHIVCEKCVFKKKISSILHCRECGVKTAFSPGRAYREITQPHFYLIGLLNYLESKSGAVFDLNFSKQYRLEQETRTSTCTVLNEPYKSDQCNECGYNTNFFCVQCTVPYCRKCYERIHKTAKALSKHTYSLLGRNYTCLGANDSKIFDQKDQKCKIHYKRIMDHYCTECERICCSSCSNYYHPNHNVIPIYEENKKHITIIQDLLENFKLARESTRQALKLHLLKKMAKLIIFSLLLCASLVYCVSFPFDNLKIVGGENARPNQFPHQISLQFGKKHKCGGSIISDRWILTAGHCVQYPKESLTVLAGSILLSRGGVTRSIKQIINHSKYSQFQYDIALIELDQPLVFSDSIKAIKLAHNEIPDDSAIVISGWGRLYNNGPIPDNLQFNKNIKKMSNYVCSVLYRSTFYDGLICLKHSFGEGACNGDSGGPATFNGELVGVTSFILGDCAAQYPDGYTKVSNFINWINEKTGLKL